MRTLTWLQFPVSIASGPTGLEIDNTPLRWESATVARQIDTLGLSKDGGIIRVSLVNIT